MPVFTVFYSHPLYCPEGNRYETTSPSAEVLGGLMSVVLPDYFIWNDVPDDLDVIAAIPFYLEIAIFDGSHSTRPSGPPVWGIR